jgi:hypothetical protein
MTMTMTMTKAEALDEARSRWGHYASVECRHSGDEPANSRWICKVYYSFGGPDLGFAGQGHSFEEAFAAADRRSR